MSQYTIAGLACCLLFEIVVMRRLEDNNRHQLRIYQIEKQRENNIMFDKSERRRIMERAEIEARKYMVQQEMPKIE